MTDESESEIVGFEGTRARSQGTLEREFRALSPRQMHLHLV